MTDKWSPSVMAEMRMVLVFPGPTSDPVSIIIGSFGFIISLSLPKAMAWLTRRSMSSAQLSNGVADVIWVWR